MNNKKKSILKEVLEKVSMSDTGITLDEKYAPIGFPIETSAKKRKEEKIYPNLYLTCKEAPVLKGSSAGDEKLLIVKAKIKNITVRDDEKRGKNSDYSIEIKKIGIIEEEDEKEEEEEE